MSATYDVKRDLLAAFRSLMTPLIRILLRSGITFQEFAGVLKDVYVTVCAREMTVPGRRMTLSRVAIATGLTRREVAKIIRSEGNTQWGVWSNAGLAASVLEAWHSDSAFLAPYGYPRDLKIDGPDQVPTFEDLVRRFSSDVSHEVLVGELIRVGAARVLEGGQYLRVQKRTYIPTDMTAEMIQIFSQAVRRYIETVDFNLGKGKSQEKRFDRMVYPDEGLRLVDIEIYQQEIREYLETVIQEIDQKSATYPRPARKRGEQSVQVGVGIYFYQETAEDKTPLAESFTDIKEFENDDLDD
ncbi:MAG TPA: DUF6502 family protein [Steroidobacteraceae bacterium]|nr:DUF6502 family protein [Steroidobacteraceae bacterium]